jgi:hypothetical protein
MEKIENINYVAELMLRGNLITFTQFVDFKKQKDEDKEFFLDKIYKENKEFGIKEITNEDVASFARKEQLKTINLFKTFKN